MVSVRFCLLVYNGVILGATFGIAIAAGNGPPLFQQVLAHGVLEMSCIVVAGAAGIRIGWAMIDPGTRPRREAIVAEARAGAEMFIGVALLLVLAGLVEGFVTPSGQSLGFVSVVGFGLGIAFWAGVFILGRPRLGYRPRSRLESQVGRDARFAEPGRRRFDHDRAHAAQSGRDSGPSIEHVDRDRGAVHVPRRPSVSGPPRVASRDQ